MICGICGYDAVDFAAMRAHHCAVEVGRMRLSIYRVLRAVEADPSGAVKYVESLRPWARAPERG